MHQLLLRTAALLLALSPATAGHCAAADTATVLPALIEPARVPAGSFFRITYRWEAAEPLSAAYQAFVHFLDPKGGIAFQGDHQLAIGTGTPGWRGGVSYQLRVIVPQQLAEGTYRVALGLYRAEKRLSLTAGAGVADLGNHSYQVGTVVIDARAPYPQADTEKTPTLNLDGWTLTFREEFDGPLDVSAWGPGTRWIAHTPWNGDFGDAAFANPQEGFPFTIHDGILRIEARKDPEFAHTDGYKRPWRTGLLASNDKHGEGFAQQYGYFEARARLPQGPGVWPAFWLSTTTRKSPPGAGTESAVEIDVFEYYGVNPNGFGATVHVWKPQPHRAVGHWVVTRPGEPARDFHRYGCLVDPAEITLYFDGIEVWRTPTPQEHTRPLMLLLNLALGSGWPIDQTVNPSFLEVDYVRVYARPAVPAPAK